MPTPQVNKLGQVYRCFVCGAEVSVIRRASGELAPRCCNEPMHLLPQRHQVYRCPVCGAELVIIRTGAGPLTPRCCNTPMVSLKMAG